MADIGSRRAVIAVSEVAMPVWRRGRILERIQVSTDQRDHYRVSQAVGAVMGQKGSRLSAKAPLRRFERSGGRGEYCGCPVRSVRTVSWPEQGASMRR